MSQIEYREYHPDDAASFLRLHDTAFPPITAEYWARWSKGAPVTASVAVMGGEVVGTVPFIFRDFRVRPGMTVRVAWEFSVCVRPDLRGTGIGSRLMDAAKQFLRGRAAAMMVYRNDESSAGYRYYARNGHADLLYARPWSPVPCVALTDVGQAGGAGWQGASDLAIPPASSVPWAEFLAGEARYLELFESAYRTRGGFPERGPGFHAPAMETAQYAEVPLDLSVFAQGDASGETAGYLIAGRERMNPALHLLEIATRDGDLAPAMPLLSAFCRLAGDEGVPAVTMTNDGSPYLPALRALGFRPRLRPQASMMIMAYPLEPDHLAAAAWQESAATAPLEVVARTPSREVTLHRGSAGARRVTLEMNEAILARLVFCRLDLQSAVAQEIVTAVDASDADIAATAHALPFTPWVYHYLDQI